MLVVVAYDISDDLRRTRLHRFLLRWGNPVQESVFECLVDHPQYDAIKRGVQRIVHEQHDDRVNYYLLCADCTRRSEDGHGPRDIDATDAWVL